MFLGDLMMVRREIDPMRDRSRFGGMNKVTAHSMTDFENLLSSHVLEIQDFRDPRIIPPVSPLNHPFEERQRPRLRVLFRAERPACAVVPGQPGLLISVSVEGERRHHVADRAVLGGLRHKIAVIATSMELSHRSQVIAIGGVLPCRILWQREVTSSWLVQPAGRIFRQQSSAPTSGPSM